jgi:hypothetical protein
VKRSPVALHRATVVAAVACLSLGACSLNRRAPKPTDPALVAAQEWPEARRMALNAALVHDVNTADSVLRAFGARFPGTTPAADAVYLRAFIRLDPVGDAVPSAETLRTARSLLDSYIAGGPLQEHYVESVLLRRVIGRLDSLRPAPPPEPVREVTSSSAGTVARDSLRLRDDEIARLRAELESTKAELERIRRRLAPRRP